MILPSILTELLQREREGACRFMAAGNLRVYIDDDGQ